MSEVFSVRGGDSTEKNTGTRIVINTLQIQNDDSCCSGCISRCGLALLAGLKAHASAASEVDFLFVCLTLTCSISHFAIVCAADGACLHY